MKSLKRAWARLGASLLVVRHQKILVWYQVIGFFCTLAIVALTALLIVAIHHRYDSLLFSILQGLVGIIGFMIVNLVGIFLSAALFSAATSALEGEKVSFKDPLAKSWNNRRALGGWWLFSCGIFCILFMVQLGLDKLANLFGGVATRVVSMIIGHTLSLSWAFAAYFAVPVLMTHPDKPTPTLKRSAELFRKSWGENVIADTALGGFFLLILSLSVLLTMGINYLIYVLKPTVDPMVFLYVFVSVSGFSLASFLLLSVTAFSVFNASLYRYAETGDYVGPFSKEMIQGAFKPKKKSFFARK